MGSHLLQLRIAQKCLLFVFLAHAVASLIPDAGSHLQLTSVVSGNDGKAKFECWEISTPFIGYPTVGESISPLAEVSNISYVVLPPRSDEGIHKPPHPMFFVLLSGLAQVTLPDAPDDDDENELWIVPGVNGLIVAADTVGEGHVTRYPADIPSVALQIPFKDGQPPQYRVVSDGICEPQDSTHSTGWTAEGAQLPLAWPAK